MPKITKWNGAGDPPISSGNDNCPSGTGNCTPLKAEVTKWDGINLGQSSKRPEKSRRKPVPSIPSLAPLMEQSSKQAPTDALFVGTADGHETETDYLNL